MWLASEQPDLSFSVKSVPRTLSLVGKKVSFLRHKMLIAVVVSSLTYPVLSFRAQQALQFPPTTKKVVSDEYHGVKVSEDYRWLEDVNDPAVRRWIDAQNQFSSSILEKIPARTAIANRMKDILTNQQVSYRSFYQRKMFFALKTQPPKNQPLLVMLKSPDQLDSEQIILDPNVMNPKGTTAMDWYVPSRDGRFVAVSLSESGSEDGSAHVYETATGTKLPDIIPRVQYPTGAGSLEWNKDSTGLYYTRYPQGNERPPADVNFYQQVYFHKLGTNVSEDTYVIGREFPRIAKIILSTNDDGSYLLASVANGDGGEFAH